MSSALLLMSGKRTYAQKILTVQRASMVGYWPSWDLSGTQATEVANGRHGTYSGVTLGQTGIGDGRAAPLYNGTSNFTNLYTAGMAGAFNAAEGTMLAWFKVAGSGVWTDATARICVQFRTDANNRVFFQKSGTSNTLTYFYNAGGVSKTASVGSQTSTGWIAVAMTWSKVADQFKFYLNGTQQGATSTGLGTWSGALASTACLAGASATSAGANFWSGYVAHVALWSTPLSAADVAKISSLP